MDTTVEVWTVSGGEDALVGRLYARTVRGYVSAPFEYDSSWLARPDAYTIDPAYLLQPGPQVHPAGPLARVFGDSEPDRWGRELLKRAAHARGERDPDELGVLLGVDDQLRMGALRLRLPGGPFLAEPGDNRVPPLIDLERLARLSEMVENDAAFDQLRELARAGTSLGGARPKANVVDGSGHLALVKFSSTADTYPVIAWEAVALDLAGRAGITTPHWRLERVGGRPVLILDRFDRTWDTNGRMHRVPYLSAMSLLQLRDGDQSSYAEIGEVLGVDAEPDAADLAELYRRAAFGLLIGNTDDHLRNHGVLRRDGRWRLCPAFDLNPGTQKSAHATSIYPGEPDTVDTLLACAGYFRLTEAQAQGILIDVHRAVAGWHAGAARQGLGTAEQTLLEPAFDNEHVHRVGELEHDG